MRITLAALAACLMVSALPETMLAQGGSTAVPFLLISPNSRASGMGDGGTGLADDAAALFWNPGGLGYLKGNEVSISHVPWLPQFHMSDLFYDYFNYRTDVPDWGGTLAASVTYMNLGEFVKTTEEGPEPVGTFKAFEVAATVGFGALVSDELGVGLNLRFINDRLSPVGTAQEQGDGIAYDFSVDVGALYKPKTFMIPFADVDAGGLFSLGLNVSNLGPKVTYIDAAQADPLPTQFRFGLGLYPVKDDYNSLAMDIDFARLLVYRHGVTSDPFYRAIITSWTGPSLNYVIRSFTTSVGAEYWYGNPKLIALRLGYFYEDPTMGGRNYMTYGAGIRYDIYGFDFSYYSSSDSNSPLSDTIRFTVLINWGGGN